MPLGGIEKKKGVFWVGMKGRDREGGGECNLKGCQNRGADRLEVAAAGSPFSTDSLRGRAGRKGYGTGIFAISYLLATGGGSADRSEASGGRQLKIGLITKIDQGIGLNLGLGDCIGLEQCVRGSD